MIQHPPGRDPAAFVAGLQARDPIRAAAVARAMLADRRRLGRQWQAVARFAIAEADWSLAVDAMRAYVRDGPTPDRQIALAETLAQAGRGSEARPILERIAATTPAALHFLGVLRIEAGERGAGVDALRAALKIQPASGQSWLALANAHPFAHGDATFTMLEAAAAGFARGPAAERAAWLYARGKALDDLGEHDRAFAAFSEGARLVAAARPYDADADRHQALATIAALTPAWIDALPASGGAERCLFVTGKPRSGTTLVARILDAHSAVAGEGEVNLIGPAADAVGGSDGAAIRGRNDDGWRRFRERHAQLVDGRFPGTKLAVDKSLNTSRLAAMIRMG